MLERNQRCQQAYTYSGKTERNLASSFLLLPETGLPGAPREGLLLLPLFYKLSCSSAGVAINIDSPKLGMLFPVSGAPIPYLLAKDLMALLREFSFLLLPCIGSLSQDGLGGNRQEGQPDARGRRTVLDVVSAALCGKWLVLALWLSVGPLESLCKQDILPTH